MSPQSITRTILLLCAVLALAWIGYWRATSNLSTVASRRSEATVIFTTPQATPMQLQTLPFVTSPLATPAPLRPIPITQPAQLPAITHDLLFANAKGLMRWRHAARRIDQVVAWKSPDALRQSWPDVKFTVSADGRKMLVANKALLNNINHFSLQLYDLKTEKITTLVTDTTSVLSIALAPDASWIAYSLWTIPQPKPRPWWRALFASGGCQCGEAPLTGVIYAMRVQPPYQPIRLSDCSEFAPQENCFDLQVWPAEQIHWVTRLRMPIIAYTKDTAMLAAVPVLQSNLNVSSAWFAPRSPMGRYIPVWVTRRSMRQDGPHEENSDGILDTQTARITELPGARPRERDSNRSAAWLRDGRLVVLRPAAGNERYPAVELWSLNPAREGLLQLDQLLRLPISATNYPGQPMQLANGQLAFALFNTNPANDFERGLFLLDLQRDTLRKLNRLPASTPNELHPTDEPQPADVFWSPDGAGAIFYGYNHPQSDTLLYLPADGSPPYALYPIVGDQAWGFTWLPE